MAIKYYNATLRNLEYRLRAFRDYLPQFLKDTIYSQEDKIVSAIVNQLNLRGITGYGIKIMDYAPYKTSTIKAKQRKGQPTTRVTLRDTGAFHKAMYLVVDDDGFYVTSDDRKTPVLVAKYGPEIFRLTDENLTRIIKVHIRRELAREIKKVLRER